MIIWIVFTIFRLIVPIGILRWPLWLTALAAFIDLWDYNFLPLETEADYQFYSYWDKFLDTYYLSFSAFTMHKWEDVIAKITGLVTFWIRFVGVAIFFILGKEIILFYLFNYFQNLFLFYLLFQTLTGQNQLFTNIKTFIIINVALFIPTIALEFILHVWDSTPSMILQQWINFGPLPQELTANTITGILLVILPILALVWRLRYAYSTVKTS